MIKSMTGYGHGFSGHENYTINAEVRIVNSRFLEFKIRGFTIDPHNEIKIKHLLERKIERGYVQIKIEVVLDELNNLVFNKNRFDSLMIILKKIHVEYGQRFSLSDIINTNDILTHNDSIDVDQNLIIDAVDKAVIQACEMRLLEGDEIKKDISNRIRKLQYATKKIKDISESFLKKKEISLRKKISSLLDNIDLDDSRLLQEVAFLSEKIDITEELIRCGIHFDHLLAYFEKTEPVGKRINFLLQEINREINTIGSKSPETEVTLNIVEIKGELEKIREQVQNIL